MSSPQTPIDPYSLPPLDKYSLIGIWISTMVYGVNIILYALCMYVLLQKKAKSPGQWPLLLTSCFLFILATIHIGTSFKQLLECFIAAPKTGIPGAGILYWLSFTTTTNRIKGYVYSFIDTTQDLVLIWRLYVVWGNNWMIATLPFLIEMAHFGIALFETEVSTRGNGIPYTSNLPLIAYILVIIVNVGTTAGIAGRLWYMGRRHVDSFARSWSSTSQTSNRYLAPIFTIVESGAIFTLSSIVLLGMFVNGDPRLETAVNVATQLACLTPLLIIVRVGFGLTHSIGSIQKKKTPVEINRNKNSGPKSTISTINVFRTIETDSSRTPVGSYQENGVYPLGEIKDKPTASLTDSKV